MKVLASLLISAFLLTACSKGPETEQPIDESPQPPVDDTTTDPNTPTTADIYFVELDGGGTNGDLIGCNDSIVPVSMEVTTTNLQGALTRLFTYNGQYHVPTGYYNTLHNSNLEYSSSTTEDDVTKIYLTGEPVFGGTCDTPRFENQILYTAKQFTGNTAVEIFVNNQPLQEILSSE
ncbi:hypothetical protein CVV38_00575 [Candidatus Peregrinibacteria bacterium HGW-Peregrinibacteria-1]|jgi:hypothetical protein|nr:MAG: hypothetical protein CVV38_00575 [Candidatus Peregrinibacteria bacterium HGW-Peregrinibacteria-1]